MTKGVGTLVSSQDRRAAVVPLTNWLSTARQPLVVFLGSIYIEFHLFVLPTNHPGRLSSVRWGSKKTIVLLGHRLPPSRPAPSRVAPHRPTQIRLSPSRPALGMSGIPGHALHEKDSQRQTSVGPPVSSEE